MTRASVQAGGAVALVHVHLAAIPGEAHGTRAGEGGGEVLAHPAVQTWRRQTLVHLQLTARA